MDPNSSVISDQVPQTADGTLVIIVCRAKHLPNRRKLDKQSPYVTLRLGTTAKKTPSHFRAGQTPDWTHEIRFDLNRERKPLLKLDVLDETKNDPTPIGTCDIDCSVIFQDQKRQEGKYIHDSWYNLTLNGRRAGMIYLEMTFYPSAPVLPPKLYETYENTDVMRSSTTSYGSHKELPPPPPEHPSLSHKSSVMNDIFVSSQDSKKKTFFNMSSESKSSTNTSVGVSPEEDDVFTSSPEKKNKYFDKFNKFKNKFQSKEPIRHLWSREEKESYDRANTIRPINVHDFDNLEELQKDIQFNSPTTNQFQDLDISFEHPPSPPPHSEYSYTQPESTPVVNDQLRSPSPPKTPAKTLPLRKPPPEFEVVQGMSKLNVKSPNNTSIPYSADTIGLEEQDHLPTRVYFMDKQVKSLSYSSIPNPKEPVNMDEIDPRYYAPTPGQHYGNSNKADRIGNISNNESGYLGNGKWETKFSPSIFDRIPVNDENIGFENKPHVPPKIPQGLTELEYFVLEKEKYLRDINGRRA